MGSSSARDGEGGARRRGGGDTKKSSAGASSRPSSSSSRRHGGSEKKSSSRGAPAATAAGGAGVSDDSSTASSGSDSGSDSVSIPIETQKDLYPIQLRFSDLSYRVEVEVPNPEGERRLCLPPKKLKQQLTVLQKISGTVEPGEMLAILGTSGAGKTSLLNLLAGRVRSGDIGGEILLNGLPAGGASHLTAHQTYIMQDDLMMGTQTPREVLRFSGRMRLPKETTNAQVEERVEEVLRELNLVDCADTMIGAVGESRGISGGERKRTAIGLELITNPTLLFVDEPTTGLDSTTALLITQTLKDLSRRGRTVITTIHQPSSQIFALFDKVMLLAKGEIVYFGPRKRVADYFASVDRPCPKSANPADHMLHVGYVDESDASSLDAVQTLHRAYQASDLNRTLTNAEPVRRDARVRKALGMAPVAGKSKKHLHHRDDEDGAGPVYQASAARQFKELIARHTRDKVRNPMKIRAPLGQAVILSLLIGLLYFGIGTDQASANDRLGSLFFILINQTMSAAFATVSAFGLERPLFLREHSNNMYRTTTYFLARTVGELPFQLLNTLLFGTIIFWMIGFSDSFVVFLAYSFILVLTMFTSSGIGWLISIAAPSPDVAIAIMPITLIPLMLFSGFYINSDNIPPYFVWVEALSPMRYGFEAIASVVLDGVKFTCDQDELVPPSLCNVPEDSRPDVCQCRITDGEQVLDQFAFSLDNFWWNVLALTVYAFIVRLACHWLLLWRAAKASGTA